MKRLAVFVSGRGSNMESIIRACNDGVLKGIAEVVFVYANLNAPAIAVAQQSNIDTLILKPGDYASGQDWMRDLAVQCGLRHIDLICCAGFMRKLEEPLLSEFSGRIINVHPAMLPNYPGTHAIERALEARERETGCTFHFITPDDPKGEDGSVIYDSGPIILQRPVAIVPGDTVETLKARIQAQEHEWYPKVIFWHLNGELEVTVDRTVVHKPKW